jgi:MFS family permease
MREKLLQRNIRIAYLINFLRSFIFYAPILPLYLQEQLFTVLNVTIIFAIITFGSALLEVPTGVIADYLGRKRTIVLASFLAFIDIVLLATGNTFTDFVIYAVVAAFSMSLMSGTHESLIYDSLVELKKEDTFKKVIGFNHGISPIGHSVASIIGGLIAAYSLRLPVLYSIIPFAIAFLASLFIIEPVYQRTESKSPFLHAKDSIKYLLGKRQLFLLALISFMLDAFSEPLHQISQLFYQLKHIPIEYFGFIFAFLFALSAIGSFASDAISRVFGDKKTLVLCTLLSMLVMLFATYAPGWIAVGFIVSSSLFFGIRNPVLSHLTNQEVVSGNRATVLSIRNFASSIGFALFTPVLGYLVDAEGLLFAFRVFIYLYVLVIIAELFLKNVKVERLH